MTIVAIIGRYLVASAALLAGLGGGAVEAANITWSAPQDQTGSVSDILASGTLYAAATIGANRTVNGVAFTGRTSFSGGTVAFGSAPITISGMAGIGDYGDAPPTWEANYRALVDGSVYANGGGTITIAGLTAGQSYSLQIFQAFWDRNWATRFTGGANTSALVNLSGGDGGAGASSVAQYLIGTFIADSATQTITMSSPTVATEINSNQVRTAVVDAVPEPATWAMMLGGMALAGGLLRRTRRLGIAA